MGPIPPPAIDTNAETEGDTMQTLKALAAYREWQRLVDTKVATGEHAVLLARQVREAIGAEEAETFLRLAYAYAVRSKIETEGV